MGKSKRQSIAVHSQDSAGTCKLSQVERGAIGFIRLCPSCGQSIRPGLMDYLPRPGTFKQYRCEHCASWLTIDLRSRIKLILVATIGGLPLIVCLAKLLIVMGVLTNTHGVMSFLPFSIFFVFGIAGLYVLARYTRKIARWVPVTD